MPPNHLRIVYVFEFLLALVAVFTAWSEIGGQGALDLMHWGWKTGLSFAMASSVVGLTAALAGHEHFWTFRSARWAATLVVCLLITGLVTYYYALQVDSGDSEDSGVISTMQVVPGFFRPIG